MGNIYIFQDVAYWLGYKLVKPCFFLGYMQDITEVVIHITRGPDIYVIQSYRESVYSRYCIFVNTVRRDTKWGYGTKNNDYRMGCQKSGLDTRVLCNTQVVYLLYTMKTTQR